MGLSVRFSRGYFCFSCLLLLTTLLPAFCALFLARFLYKLYLGPVKAGRKKRYLGISIYIYLDHHCPPSPFRLFWQKYRISHFFLYNNVFSNDHGDVDDDGDDNVCSPMFTNDYPLCLLASQSYAAIQHDDNDKDGANSNDFKISNINYNVNPLEWHLECFREDWASGNHCCCSFLSRVVVAAHRCCCSSCWGCCCYCCCCWCYFFLCPWHWQSCFVCFKHNAS